MISHPRELFVRSCMGMRQLADVGWAVPTEFPHFSRNGGHGPPYGARQSRQDPTHLHVWDLGLCPLVEPGVSLAHIATHASSHGAGKEEVAR